MANNNEKIEVRASKETKEQFEKLVEESGLSKVDFMPRLIEAYESMMLKTALPGRKDEIESFDAAHLLLKDLYRNSLNLALLAKSTAMQETKMELDTKTRTIADLQVRQEEMESKIKLLESDKSGLGKQVSSLTKENEKLKEVIKEKETALQSNDDAKNVIAQLKEIVNAMQLHVVDSQNKKAE